MILTLKELSNYLRVNERTILRMQKTGQIQGIKIGGQWRFNGSQIDSLFFPGGPLEDPATAVPLDEFMPKSISVPASRLLHEKRIIFDMKAETAQEAVDELVDVVGNNSLCLQVSELRAAVHAREKLLSTGIGNSVAIPHPRDPITNLREPTVLIVGKSQKGIDYNAIDGQPVHLFFLICSQTIQSHLNILGRLANLCSNNDTLKGLITAADAEQFTREVIKSEQKDFINQG